jgi:hypothetical protein
LSTGADLYLTDDRKRLAMMTARAYTTLSKTHHQKPGYPAFAG